MEPAGRPLSIVFRVGAAPGDLPLREAVSAVASIHGDGVLPVLPIVRDDATDRQGAYLYHRQTGAPQQITISRQALSPALSCLHEIGHFLDHQALGQAGQFASDSAEALADWRQAIRTSRSYRWLAWLRSVDDADQVYVEYALSWPELFARSYTQYIASRCKSEAIKQKFNALRLTPNEQIYPGYWEDSAFAAISEEMDRLFLWKGWIQ